VPVLLVLDAGDRLDAARRDDVGLAGNDALGCEDDRLQTPKSKSGSRSRPAR
jgi:hypothetical protein